MPAAAVIPAQQVYSYTVAVKKLVVGFECLAPGAVLLLLGAAHVGQSVAAVVLTDDGSGLLTSLL